MTETTQRLERLRAEAVERVAGLRADVADIVGRASSTTGDDEHDPEGATIGFERAQLLALLAAAEQRLAAVDAALRRLGEGRYGYCVDCGGRIAPARLAARPETPHCLGCAQRRR